MYTLQRLLEPSTLKPVAACMCLSHKSSIACPLGGGCLLACAYCGPVLVLAGAVPVSEQMLRAHGAHVRSEVPCLPCVHSSMPSCAQICRALPVRNVCTCWHRTPPGLPRTHLQQNPITHTLSTPHYLVTTLSKYHATWKLNAPKCNLAVFARLSVPNLLASAYLTARRLPAAVPPVPAVAAAAPACRPHCPR